MSPNDSLSYLPLNGMYEGFFGNLQKNSASNGTKFAFARILSRFESTRR